MRLSFCARHLCDIIAWLTWLMHDARCPRSGAGAALRKHSSGCALFVKPNPVWTIEQLRYYARAKHRRLIVAGHLREHPRFARGLDVCAGRA
eukprot:757920-Pyramimonas_sp.AAC.1